MIWPVGRIFLEPGDDQRHGAAPNRFMTLIAMLDLDDRGNPPPGANAASRFVEGHERQASLANRPPPMMRSAYGAMRPRSSRSEVTTQSGPA